MIFSDLNYTKIYCTDLKNINSNLIKSKYNNIKFKKIDALDINFPDCSFDIIGCKSLLGGIAANQPTAINIAINEIYRVLKKNGKFIFAENIEGAFLHKLIRRYFKSSGWYFPKLNDLIYSLDKFEQVNYETTGYFTILSRNETIKSKLFLLDEKIKNMISEKSKYIIYGTATK